MTTVILITFGIIALGGILVGAVWFMSYARRFVPAGEITRPAATTRLSFHWRYIALPLALLLLSVILAAYFYHLLPAKVATHFQLDGTPDRWLSPAVTMVWALVTQLLLTLLAAAVTWVVARMGFLFQQVRDTWLKPERILLFMGNAIALPQLILCFATADIFSYNSYQQHIMPMWLFLLIILGLATLALGVLMTLAISKAKHSGQKIKEQSDRTQAKG
jgi:uncharacterized membrane protein